MKQVVLAEDHHIVRFGLKTILEKYFQVTDVANGKQVLDILDGGHQPDLIIYDLSLPKLDGRVLNTSLNEQYPDIKQMVLTGNDDLNTVLEMFKTGIHAYLVKNIDEEELIFAINHVLSGKKYISWSLAFNSLELLINKQFLNRAVKPIEFSERELQVAMLIGEGHTNEKIAEILFLSKRTVEGHRNNLIEKTGVKNTPALIRFMILSGYLT